MPIRLITPKLGKDRSNYVCEAMIYIELDKKYCFQAVQTLAINLKVHILCFFSSYFVFYLPAISGKSQYTEYSPKAH